MTHVAAWIPPMDRRASQWCILRTSPLRLSSLVMIRDAVRLGAGVARLPLSLVSQDIARGRLIACGDVPTSRIALWALYPSRRLLNARVSAFLEYLRQSFPNGTAEELAAFLDDRR